MKCYYAIEIIGYGAKRRYVIKDVLKTSENDWRICPVHCARPFRTEAGARQFAADHGFEIEAVGDLYQIMI